MDYVLHQKNEIKEDGKCPLMATLSVGKLSEIRFSIKTCPKYYLIRDLFLFSCFTGIPYGDMRYLTDEDKVALLCKI